MGDVAKLKPLEKITVDNEDSESIMSSDAYQEELETMSHVDGSEWQDEIELEKGWDQHFEGRTGEENGYTGDHKAGGSLSRPGIHQFAQIRAWISKEIRRDGQCCHRKIKDPPN